MKTEIVQLLEEIADILELKGENIFKINAFKNGALTLKRLNDEEFEDLVTSKRLNEVKGIGKGLQSVIYEFIDLEESKTLTELKSEFPESLFELFKIRGLGPKKISLLFKDHQIKSISELEQFIELGNLKEIKGFGAAIESKIIDEIKNIKVNQNFIHLHAAEKIASELKLIFDNFESIKSFEISGEFRRSREIISKLDFVFFVDDIDKLQNELSENIKFNLINENRTIQILDKQIPIICHLEFSHSEFIKRLFVTTGADEIIDKFRLDIIPKTEAEIFEKSNFPYLAPELREKDYLEFVQNHKSENNLIELEDLKGLLHFHSTFSDGNNSIKEMVVAGKNLGFEYFVICDHSKTAIYANGLSEERILLQKKELSDLISETKLHIFHGIESDILTDGSLDYSEDFFSNFNFVVASVHSNFSLSEEEMTQRIVKAIENPNTDILGHPTGRILLRRAPYKVNIHKIIDACSKNNVAIEINANPYRLDLDWKNIFYAREKGCLFSINADAHSISDISLTKFGVRIARKGGISKEEVINCFSLNEFKKFLNRKIRRDV
ncbi:MAG: DNA polymerase/3'-5' exonuclease PolX [Chlorobiaceae bacterium]|nr:DNA polymerase/3'-5' exonuclease PolX [Chlorobiaceae bacterium]MBA4308783.1 DNA polymerase/3'-5' exonuclease PolX [Chlorobiaceae bacterium]